MGKMSRDKGKRGEREVVDAFRAEGMNAYRGSPLQAAHEGGCEENAPDVVVKEYPRLHIEVKRTEAYALPAWERQVEAATALDRDGVIIYRRNGRPWRAVVPLSLLTRLLANSYHYLEDR